MQALCNNLRMDKNFGSILKQWRQQRRYSQLQLALELGVSSRHLSFLETGRSKPSREMLLNIALFLLIPKLETNQALLAAGYAPLYTSSDPKSLQPALDAIQLMLSKQLPYPAIVFNQDWDLIDANTAAYTLLASLGYSCRNFLELLIADQPQKRLINWNEIAIHTLQRIHQETLSKGISTKLKQLIEQLEPLIEPQQCETQHAQIMLSSQLMVEEQTLSFFSVLAQLSSIQDLVISEYKIELMFPADEATKHFYEKLVAQEQNLAN